jgi:hypothetical protein
VLYKQNSLSNVRRELHKVKQMPSWGRVQGDEWDRASRFIYTVRTLDALRRETRRVAAELGLPPRDFGSYVIRRWYNFHTHQAALDVILAYPRTRPEPDPFHHTVDFYLDDKGFDLKLTPLPRGFGHDIAYARAHPEELAHWLYERQSAQGRFHAANRLLVVLHDTANPNYTWELRRDFAQLEQAIHTFLDEPRSMRVEFTDQWGKRHRPTTGVIFCVRE